MRGKHRSTPMEDLVAQAKGLAKQECRRSSSSPRI